MIESTDSFMERKPFLCFICENPLETSKLHGNDGKSINVQVSTLFCSIVSRYLNFNSFQSKTSRTLSLSTSTDDKNAENLECCKCCSVMVKTVCELYDELKNLQLRLHWNLEKIGESMKSYNKSANNQLGCEDFKRQFMEKVDAISRDQTPHLKLNKITPPKGQIQQNLENQNVYIIKLETYNDDDDDAEEFLSAHHNHDEDKNKNSELDIKMKMEIENHDDIESPVEPEESLNVKPEQTEDQHKIVGEAEIKTKRRRRQNNPVAGKKFPCAFCEKLIACKRNLWRHERIHHKGEKLYPCPTCGERFSNMQERKSHEVSNHDRGGKPKCRFCGKAFPRNKERVRHEWTHTKLRPFLCSVCGRRFNDSGNATKHLRKEHGNLDDAKIVKCFNSYRDFKNIGLNNTEIKTAA